MKAENYKIEFDFDLTKKIYQGKEEILVSLDNEKELKLDAVDLKIFEVKVNNQKTDFDLGKDNIILSILLYYKTI